MNAATIRNFGESKGLDFGTDVLAAEVKGVGYVIYVDKEDYTEATKIFENSYNTSVVVKLKEDMSKNQKIEYGLAKGGVDFSEIDKFFNLFNIFGGQTANACQSNCPGTSYINLTGDLSGHKGINAKFSIGLPDFVTSVEAIKNKKSTEVEQVVTDSNGNTYKVKTKIDELDSKVLEASKNSGGSPDFKWGNPKSGPTYGHTFIDHTSKLKDSQLIDRARSLKHQVGKWVNDQEAAAFLSNVAKNGPGVYDVPLPDNLKGKVFLPDGTEISPNMVRVVVKPTGGVKTGFPFNDKYPTSKPKDF